MEAKLSCTHVLLPDQTPSLCCEPAEDVEIDWFQISSAHATVPGSFTGQW